MSRQNLGNSTLGIGIENLSFLIASPRMLGSSNLLRRHVSKHAIPFFINLLDSLR